MGVGESHQEVVRYFPPPNANLVQGVVARGRVAHALQPRRRGWCYPLRYRRVCPTSVPTLAPTSCLVPYHRSISGSDFPSLSFLSAHHSHRLVLAHVLPPNASHIHSSRGAAASSLGRARQRKKRASSVNLLADNTSAAQSSAAATRTAERVLATVKAAGCGSEKFKVTVDLSCIEEG